MSFGFGFALPHWQTLSGGFSPASLFSAGEQGAWYDPSDLTTLFQDSAGTTPVTAVEQPVGRILDKSGRGNHATQSTSASRPTLRARYNLLLQSEAFNTTWSAGNVTVTANTTATTDPLGGNTADKLAESNTSNVEHYVVQTLTVSAAQHTFSVYLKAAERTWASIQFTTGPLASTWFNLAADGSGGVGTVASGFTAAATYVGNGWYRCSITGTSTAASWSVVINPALGNGVSAVYAGTVGSGIYAWGAQLVPTAVFPSNTYQQITTATSYNTSSAFPRYLFFDGVDDSLLTNSVDFSAGDKMTVWAGVTKSSDSAQGVVTELSATIAANNGAFLLTAPNSAAANYNFSSKGTTQVDNTVTTYAAPIVNVLSAQGNISGPSNVVRANAVQVGSVSTTQGTGNYGNYPLYIGRRNNASQPLNGNIYSLIIRGAQSTAAQISSTESWVAAKTPLGSL